MNLTELRTIAERIQAIEFDHVFTLHPDGSITDPEGVWAPSVYHDPDNDIHIDDPDWSAMTGLTGQYSYSGAVMHASEYVGPGVARAMLELTDDGEAGTPVTFALVVVYDPIPRCPECHEPMSATSDGFYRHEGYANGRTPCGISATDTTDDDNIVGWAIVYRDEA